MKFRSLLGVMVTTVLLVSPSHAQSTRAKTESSVGVMARITQAMDTLKAKLTQATTQATKATSTRPSTRAKADTQG